MTEDTKPVEEATIMPEADEPEVDFDYDRAASLLNIVQLVAGVAPQMTAISGEAMSELREMNDALTEINRNRTKIARAKAEYEAAKAAEEARVRQAEDAERLRQEDERRKAAPSQVPTPNPALDPNPIPSQPIDHTKTAEQINANEAEVDHRRRLAGESLATTAGNPNPPIRRTL